MGEHLDVEVLGAYARGALGDPEAEAVLRHCRGCRECGDRLAVILLLRMHGSRMARRRGVLAGIAAAVVVVMIATALILSNYAVEPTRNGASPPRVAPPADNPWAAYATHETVSKYIAGVLYGRSDRTAAGDSAPMLRAAVEDLAAERYQAAIDKLTPAVRSRPRDLAAAAWLGIALYLSGDDSDRVGQLLFAGTRSALETIERHSYYYLGNHYLRVGAADDGVLMLYQVSPVEIRIGSMAKAQLEEMPIAELDLVPALHRFLDKQRAWAK